MPKAFLIWKGSEVVNRIVPNDPPGFSMDDLKATYPDPEYGIQTFEDPSDPLFINPKQGELNNA